MEINDYLKRQQCNGRFPEILDKSSFYVRLSAALAGAAWGGLAWRGERFGAGNSLIPPVRRQSPWRSGFSGFLQAKMSQTCPIYTSGESTG
ncbi:hypothetical protein [Verminephrobacter aporrectodeae]|uniref:hypothetical protein n=1 Tax=Verminephrobacter aporrectodeae TaxID=1110389 RepID=UPI0022373802|nr:hypothetical protein [Verminephrobacter aporrectodeae]